MGNSNNKTQLFQNLKLQPASGSTGSTASPPTGRRHREHDGRYHPRPELDLDKLALRHRERAGHPHPAGRGKPLHRWEYRGRTVPQVITTHCTAPNAQPSWGIDLWPAPVRSVRSPRGPARGYPRRSGGEASPFRRETWSTPRTGQVRFASSGDTVIDASPSNPYMITGMLYSLATS